MPELFTTMYQDRQICIFDIQDEYGQYIEEVRSEFRKASQENELFCPECNGALELCAGAIVAPYFRHKAIRDCPISRELKTQAGQRMYYGKKMLYSLGKTAIEGDIILHEGKTDLPLHPVMFQIDDNEEAFL